MSTTGPTSIGFSGLRGKEMKKEVFQQLLDRLKNRRKMIIDLALTSGTSTRADFGVPQAITLLNNISCSKEAETVTCG